MMQFLLQLSRGRSVLLLLLLLAYACGTAGSVEYTPAGQKREGCRCNQCGPGTYSSNGLSSECGCSSGCSCCPAGQYQQTSGQRGCKACRGGTYSTGCSRGCTACPEGSSSGDGASMCHCSPGFYSTAESQTCLACPTGKYSKGSGADSCAFCPAGQYQGSTGQAGCKTCNAGTFSLGGASSCTACPEGSTSGSSASTCYCIPGYFSSSGGQPCSACPVGQYSTTNSATSCTLCSAGSSTGNATAVEGFPVSLSSAWSPAAAQTSCALCPEHTFSSSAGADCTLCPRFTDPMDSIEPGSTACSSPGSLGPAGGRAQDLRAMVVAYLAEHGVEDIPEGRRAEEVVNPGSGEKEPPSSSFLAHLKSTVELLAMAGLPFDVCIAGALSAVYETSEQSPTPEKRGEITGKFGHIAEELAYLFHVAKGSKNLERGELAHRYTNTQIPLSDYAERLRDLRLLEAANLIAQGYRQSDLKKLFPTIAETWERQNKMADAGRALAERFEQPFGPQFLHLGVSLAPQMDRVLLTVPVEVGPAPSPGIVTWNDRFWISAPSFQALEDKLAELAGLNNETYNTQHRKDDWRTRGSFAYTIRGERDWGMPLAPLQNILSLAGTRAVHSGQVVYPQSRGSAPLALDIDVVFVPLEDERKSEADLSGSTPKPLSLSLLVGAGSDGQSEQEARRFSSDLQTFGYAVVSADAADHATIRDSYEAFAALIRTVPLESRQCFQDVDLRNLISLGYLRSELYGREWVELHTGGGSSILDKAKSCSSSQSGGPSDLPALVQRMLAASNLLELRATQLFALLVADAGLAISAQATNATQKSCQGYSRSAHRFYHNLPAAPAALPAKMKTDFSLLTLSPRGSPPALRLHHSRTMRVLEPERNLAPEQWVVFTGEMLAYLSQGKFPASLNSISKSSESSFSMPFFLRTGPKQVLSHRKTVSYQVDGRWASWSPLLHGLQEDC